MKLTFGFSPCPNDTFMFEPIVNKKIDTKGYEFEFIMEDVEYLNKAALNHQTDITKLSFNAFTQLVHQYQLLHSGSALGNNCGPLLIATKSYDINDVNDLTIAIPGYNTTAYLLLKHAFPHVNKMKEMIFSDIEESVISGEVNAGLIIHENRFTYQDKGLMKILDLGEYWEQTTGSPIPLGGIAIKRDLSPKIKSDINQILYDSVFYAFQNPMSGWDFIKQHAQEMSDDVIKSHIQLYVNHESQMLSNNGKKAIELLFKNKGIQINMNAVLVSDHK